MLNIFKKAWTSYLEHNDLPGTSSSLLWDGGKTVMRGKISQHIRRRRKPKGSRIRGKKAFGASLEEEAIGKLRKGEVEFNKSLTKIY